MNVRAVAGLGAASLVAVAIVMAVTGWAVMANGLGFGTGVDTVWDGREGPLVLAASTAVAAAAAIALLAERRPATAASLAIVAASTTGSLIERSSSSPALAALGAAATPLAIPALFALATLRRRWRAARVVGWIAAVLAAVALAALRDPFRDPLCAGECGTNPFMVAPQPAGVAIVRWVIAALAVAALLGGIVACIPERGSRLDGSVSTWVAVSAVPASAVVSFMLTTEAAWVSGALQQLVRPAAAWVAAFTLLAAAHIAAAVLAAHRRASIVALADDLAAEASPGDDLTRRVRSALGEPTARIAFPVGGGSFVDAAGAPVPGPRPDEVGTPVRRGDRVVAVIVHSAATTSAQLTAAFDGAGGLALANAGTRARLEAGLAQLTSSRRRLLDAEDETRRSIERNLHDGVQQTLLVLQYELSLAAAQADIPTRIELERIRDGVRAVTERTREIGHGVFPMSLDDVGLESGLQRLADDSAVPFEPLVDLPGRPPRAVERTAYLVARDAIRNGRGPVRLRASAGLGGLVVEVAGDAPSTVTQDRIAALGGTVETTQNGTKVVLPCAWS